ncbi:MAG TPA: hypothetical protein VFH26_06955, partial [Gemmatimonadales bacterium]|nr:hypothetical protein [Gemmatimonadales bacterium]
VSIESLGYEPDTEAVPIGSLAPDESPGTAATAAPGIEASFRTFDLLIKDRAPGAPSLDALLKQGRSEPEAEPVAIAALMYRGHAALERAAVVRHQITAELSRKASLESLQPLFQELLDLVPLALEQS